MKSKLDNDIIGITYDTKNIENRQSNVNHVAKIELGIGRKVGENEEKPWWIGASI